jgi:UDP:flavonoid glycosyltransferase YjiC (YdhE family)
MLEVLLEAFADDPDVLLVVSAGSVLSEDDEPEWPANVVLRDFLPQVELLERYIDVFVTHHGANSTAESILAGVPMVSLPGVGDQIVNAKLTLTAGAAVCLWDVSDPFASCNGELFRQAARLALREPSHRDACVELRREMSSAGGADEAARLVVLLAGRP